MLRIRAVSELPKRSSRLRFEEAFHAPQNTPIDIVTKPTREETQNLTLIIVAVTLAMAIFLGTLDYIFQALVAGIIIGDWIRIAVSIVLFLGGVAAFYYNNQEA